MEKPMQDGLTMLANAVTYLQTCVQESEIRESVDLRALQLEDIGWVCLEGQEGDTGLSLGTLHDLSEKLRDQAAMNPLHKRGAQLRQVYVFGRGIDFTGLTPKTEDIIANPYNKSALFSSQAYETNNLALFTDGNLFIIRDEKTNTLTVVPIKQISSVITDPDDSSKIRYIKRSWSDGETNKERWYPLARYKKTKVGRGIRTGGINKTITSKGSKPIPVAQDQVMYHHSTQRQTGWMFGVPDSLAASVWAIAYSNYLTDDATLVKALSQFAWSVTTANKTGRDNASVQVATPGVGGTSIMGSNNALGSVGVPSAQVNFNNGQPLAAMVATSFGVPVIALLSSPGATGGSYGAATTLDEPTVKGMASIQDSWVILYEEILSDMGSPKVETTFPNINQDPTYRETQSIGLAYSDGRLHQDEARAATLKALDVKQLHEELPEPDEFNAGGTKNDTTNPSPSQGNSGSTPGGVNQDIGDHTTDE